MRRNGNHRIDPSAHRPIRCIGQDSVLDRARATHHRSCPELRRTGWGVRYPSAILLRRRTYTELRGLDSFLERFRYLRLSGNVGEATFGFDRYINQRFYRSREWKDIRHHVIVRDNGCDLGIEGREINGVVLIHHMNPIDAEDIVSLSQDILDPEFLISTTHDTHNAIHYGDERQLPRPFVPRSSGDTKLW